MSSSARQRSSRAPGGCRKDSEAGEVGRVRGAVSLPVGRYRPPLQMKLADRVSLRSRQRKLRLFLEELRPSPETTVVDVGADELGFGDAPGCATMNFFEELYPWPSA